MSGSSSSYSTQCKLSNDYYASPIGNTNDVGPREVVYRFGIKYLATLSHSVIMTVFSPDLILHLLDLSYSEAGTGIG